MLTQSLNHSLRQGDLHGIRLGSDGPLFSHLLFADDCLLFSRATIRDCRGFKRILQSYCRQSGQRVNLDKSMVIFSPKIKSSTAASLVSILQIRQVNRLDCYLGLPLRPTRLKMEDLQPICDKIVGKLTSWKWRLLSFAGRCTMIRSVLCSIPIHIVSHAAIPVAFLKWFDRTIRNFLWGHDYGSKAVHTISWSSICLPKRLGGLGIPSISSWWQCLLSKVAGQVLLHPSSLLARSLSAKYRFGGTWFDYKPSRSASPLWKAISNAATFIASDFRWSIGNGRSIRWDTDPWLCGVPFSRLPLTFCSSYLTPGSLLNSLMMDGSWNGDLIASLFPPPLVDNILSVPCGGEGLEDVLTWGKGYCDRVSVSEVYLSSIDIDPTPAMKCAALVWNLDASPRVLHFLWKVIRGGLPTSLLLSARLPCISPLCPRCQLVDESLDHLFIECPISSAVWSLLGESYAIYLQSMEMLLGFLCSKSTSMSQRVVKSTILHVMWCLWLGRNGVLFQGSQQSAMYIRLQAESMTQSVFSARSFQLNRPPGLWEHLSPTTVGSSCDSSIAWCSPPPGWVKLNFDGSIRALSAGAGFIIRNEFGHFLTAGSIPLRTDSVPCAELTAAWYGIRQLCSITADGYIIEGDSSTVIGWIRGSSQCLHPYLRSIRELLKTFQGSIVVQHIFREANQAADFFAGTAGSLSAMQYWHGHPPQEISHILEADASGVSFPRGY